MKTDVVRNSERRSSVSPAFPGPPSPRISRVLAGVRPLFGAVVASPGPLPVGFFMPARGGVDALAAVVGCRDSFGGGREAGRDSPVSV